MDSGASFHVTHCNEAMKNLKLGDFGKVRLGNGEILEVTGMGDMYLMTALGTTRCLHNVRVIPGLKTKLISVGQLDEQGLDSMSKILGSTVLWDQACSISSTLLEDLSNSAFEGQWLKHTQLCEELLTHITWCKDPTFAHTLCVKIMTFPNDIKLLFLEIAK
jgi:hypothetical protein